MLHEDASPTDQADSGPARPVTPPTSQPQAVPVRRVGSSMRRSYERRVRDGFIAKYLSGQHILDIGFSGRETDIVPITDTAIGIDRDYPGYDGTHLPFPDLSQDAVLAAHVLEHIPNYPDALREWYRVLRVGGYLVIMVPHRYLYERRPDIPSRWNPEHKRFYTPASLLAEIEASLPVSGLRVRHLVDNDVDYNYAVSPNEPSRGCMEIELVLERTEPPAWTDLIQLPAHELRMMARVDGVVFQAVAERLRADVESDLLRDFIPSAGYFPPWNRLWQRFVYDGAPELDGTQVTEDRLRAAVRPLLDHVAVDAGFYCATYPSIGAAHAEGKTPDPAAHWRDRGYFNSRLGTTWDARINERLDGARQAPAS